MHKNEEKFAYFMKKMYFCMLFDKRSASLALLSC